MYFVKVASLFLWLYILCLCEPIIGNKREITVERIEPEYLDKSFGDYNYTITDKRMTYYLDLYQSGLEESMDVHLLIYSFEDNQYNARPIRISRNVCAFLALEWNYVKDSFSETDHVINSCPIEKGLYYARNYKIDPVKLPHVPWQKVMVHAKFTYTGVLVCSLKMYINIEQDDTDVVTGAPRNSSVLRSL